jgi:peptidoglycan/LPS O-acetylase OafA/YrhL
MTSSPTISAGSRVFGLDVMRALAIGLVLASHGRLYVEPLLPSIREWGRIFGYLGVEVFFVLSGFLISGILIRTVQRDAGVRSLVTFWSRRWFRTLPNYALFLVLNVLLAWWIDGWLDHWPRYGVFMQNLAWPMPRFFPESWSLAVEEWFYLLTPAVLFALVRCRLGVRRAIVITAMAFFIGSLAARIGFVMRGEPAWDVDLRKVVAYRLDALMVGVLAAYVQTYHAHLWRRVRWPAMTVGLALFATGVWMYDDLPRNESIIARTILFPVISIGCGLWIPALSAWTTARGPGARAITRISIWSYSMYLVHLPMRIVLHRAFETAAPTTSMMLLEGGLWLALTIAVSAACYRYYERPCTSLRDRLPRQLTPQRADQS